MIETIQILKNQILIIPDKFKHLIINHTIKKRVYFNSHN